MLAGDTCQEAVAELLSDILLLLIGGKLGQHCGAPQMSIDCNLQWLRDSVHESGISKRGRVGDEL
eukprot:7041344-Alexandrium_andersonii.AAC.1